MLEAIAHEVAAALGTDACFVYLYDEPTDGLVLRATHGTGIEDATSAPRMRGGEGTGAAAAEREPIMIAERAHLDPRFKAFPDTSARTSTSRSSRCQFSRVTCSRGR